MSNINRYRRRGPRTHLNFQIIDYDINNPSGVASFYEYPDSIVECDTEEIGDRSTRNFAKLQSDGQIIMSDMSLVKVSRFIQKTVYTMNTNSVWGTRQFVGNQVGGWASPPEWPAWYSSRIADAKLSTMQKAFSKVAAVDFEALVTLAEARKTAQMLSSPFSGAEGLIKRIASRKAKLIAKGLTAVAAGAAAWNEYRFGWKPLLVEIEGIMQAYGDSTASHTKPVRLTSRASFNIDHHMVVNYSKLWPGLSGLDMVGNYERSSRVSSGVIYDLKDENLVDATRRNMGLRLSDVPSSLWELVPWSFVVDRFVTVGTWLKAITPKPGVTILGSWTTVVDQQHNQSSVIECWVEPLIIGVPMRGSDSGGLFSEKLFEMRRFANPGIPAVPVWNPRSLDWQQSVDHAALIVQQIYNLGLKPFKSSNPF